MNGVVSFGFVPASAVQDTVGLCGYVLRIEPLDCLFVVLLGMGIMSRGHREDAGSLDRASKKSIRRANQ